MNNYIYLVIEGTYDVPFNVDGVFSSKSKAEEYVSQKSTYSKIPLFIVSKELDPYIHKYKSAYVVFFKDGQKQVKVENYQSKRKTTIQKVGDGYGVEIPMGTYDTTQEAVKKAENVMHYVLTHRSEFASIEQRCVVESYIARDGYDENLRSRTRVSQRKHFPIYDFDSKEIILDRNEKIIKKEQ